MASDRIQRHIERPLGEVDAALAKLDREAAFARELNMRLLLERVLSRQETLKA